MQPGQAQLTQEGMVFGTPEFMSPEQAQGEKLDAKSDIYSLAVILYEALTGKLPFEAKNSMEYIQLHVQKAPIPISKRVPGKTFPASLDAAIGKALEKDRDRRYPTAADFAAALQQVLASISVPPGSPSMPGSLSRPLSLSPARVPSLRPVPHPDDVDAGAGRSRGVPVWVFAVAMLMAVALTAVVATLLAGKH
jgi:serine/threonine-protein kinase